LIKGLRLVSPNSHDIADPPEIKEPDEMDWDAYAKHYDEMCRFNPAYQENIDALLSRLPSWRLPETPIVCDLGAGTGNYILQLSKVLKGASYVHVDFDRRMIESAQKKYRDQSMVDVTFVQKPVNQLNFEESSFDLILCVNALYAFPDRANVLTDIRRWLRPTGKLFIIDFGRRQRSLDWAMYMFRESIRSRRFREAVKAFFESREVLKQNRRSTRGQQSGRYWLHSTEEFGQFLTQSGFIVEELTSCYREYADMAICSK
jgi:ubiquinone/menaquinone biosynthesis C-methylase UbiE